VADFASACIIYRCLKIVFW